MENNEIKETFSPKQEKWSTQFLIRELEDVLADFAIEGVEIELVENELIIKQELGKGLSGLGYDQKNKSLWMCLDSTPEKKTKLNKKYNENSLLAAESDILGVELNQQENQVEISISSAHPVAVLMKILGTDYQVSLKGEYNNWQDVEPLQSNPENGRLEGVLPWNGQECECKLCIDGVSAQWDSASWQSGESQELKINL